VWKAFDLLSQSPTVEVVGAELGWTETLFESWPAGLPLAVEIPRGDTASTALSQIRVQRQSGHELIAKFRTGPTSTWPWPDEVELAHFIASTVALDVPFKLTGGLHHAIRGTYPVARTPEDNHGLLNILMATSKAVEGADPVGTPQTSRTASSGQPTMLTTPMRSVARSGPTAVVKSPTRSPNSPHSIFCPSITSPPIT
jgi:hypothetical protein